MALGLATETGEGGDFSPLIKFDARAGRIFRCDRIQDGAGNWNKSDVDLTMTFQAIFGLDQVEVGYAYFATGVAPIFVMVPLGQPLPQRPEGVDDKGKPRFKQTFRMKVKLAKTIGGDVREFASQAKVVIQALDDLHTAYEAQKAANPGKLPVVSLTGSVPVKSGGANGGQSSTNYKPVFEIVAWADRPAEMAPGAANQPASQPVQPASQPVQQMKPASQLAPAEEF